MNECNPNAKLMKSKSSEKNLFKSAFNSLKNNLNLIYIHCYTKIYRNPFLSVRETKEQKKNKESVLVAESAVNLKNTQFGLVKA